MYKCVQADKDRILSYIAKEPEINLFFYGDIENFGVDKEPVSVYAFPDEAGAYGAEPAWDALLLQFFDFYILYSQKDIFNAAVVADFLRERVVDSISGKTSLIRQITPFYPDRKLKSTYMCRLDRINLPVAHSLPPDADMRRLGQEEIGAVVDLLAGIEEFAAGYKDAEAIRKGKEQMLANLEHGCLLYGIYCGGALAATASTSAANSQSAMVVAVAVRERYRQRGYATALVEKLCEESFREGKQFLCLFYDNPDAGRIYRRIGFEECGEYAMLR